MRQNINFRKDGSRLECSVLNLYINLSKEIRSRLCNRKGRVDELRMLRPAALR
jgi:hypothetical protein